MHEKLENMRMLRRHHRLRADSYTAIDRAIRMSNAKLRTHYRMALKVSFPFPGLPCYPYELLEKRTPEPM